LKCLDGLQSARNFETSLRELKEDFTARDCRRAKFLLNVRSAEIDS
jgi:hypothetical protein